MEARKLAQELAAEKSAARKRHTALVDELARASQARDAALVAVKKLEALCTEQGLDNSIVYQV